MNTDTRSSFYANKWQSHSTERVFQTNQASWCSGNIPAFYYRGTVFGTQPCYWLSHWGVT